MVNPIPTRGKFSSQMYGIGCKYMHGKLEIFVPYTKSEKILLGGGVFCLAWLGPL